MLTVEQCHTIIHVLRHAAHDMTKEIEKYDHFDCENLVNLYKNRLAEIAIAQQAMRDELLKIRKATE